MDEEVRRTEYDDVITDERVSEWELGLPNVNDLTPLSQSLMSPELLTAFSITPEPYRNMTDVNRASQNTLSDLRGHDSEKQPLTKSQPDPVDGDGDGGGGAVEEEIDVDDVAGRASKRQRLVWTPQLHKRFVEVVAHLGVKKAVPKTIMELMNVEGLSRENVASHLQKYRLYLKRMQGVSSASNSDNNNVFGNGNESGSGNTVPMPMQYHPQMVPYAAQPNHGYQYNVMMQQRDWAGNNSNNNKFGSVSPYQHRMTPNDK